MFMRYSGDHIPWGFLTQPESEVNMRLFVANFRESTDEEELKDLFEEYGTVEEVDIWIDNYTGRSREFGFETISENGAARAIQKLDGRAWKSRRLKVREARSQS
jgi:RNA recognition motif-containing protein